MIKTLLSSLFSWRAAPTTESIRKDLEAGQVGMTAAERTGDVFSCVRVLMEGTSQLPLITYRRTADGKERAKDENEYDLFVHGPNDDQTTVEWLQVVMRDMNLRGNHYSLIVSSRRRTLELLPLHPDRTQRILRDGKVVYQHMNDRGQIVYFEPKEILHIPGVLMDPSKPYEGVTPISAVADVFDMAYDAQRFGRNAYKNGGASTLLFTHPGKLKPETKAAMREDWEKNHAGARNAGRPIILDEGLDGKPLNMTLRDAQFLESRGYTRTQICGIFRVPPHMIADLSRATFSNIEHQSIGFVTYTLLPWLERIQQRITKQLFFAAGRKDLFVEFNVNSLLKGDMKTRFEGYNRAVLTGWLTRNEVREMENRNRIEGLDEPLTPVNMETEDERAARIAAEEAAASERPAPGADPADPKSED